MQALTFALLALAILLSSASAMRHGLTGHGVTGGYYYPSTATCTQYTIPINVSTEILPWNATRWPANDYALTDFISMANTRVTADYPRPFGEPLNFTGSFEISATFCTPKKTNGHETTVLLASHGMGFDSCYWNIQIDPNEHNFVQYAMDAGYSILFYDRLGDGKSTKISGFVNQALIQVNILEQLSSLARSGKYTGSVAKPKSIVLLGHSFGSFISNALVVTQPGAADALLLTGMAYSSYNPQVILEAFNPRVASLQSPKKFGDRDAGYITNVDVIANVNNFFKAPNYTPRIAQFSESVKMPFAITEILSLNYIDLRAPNFTGPVMVLAGQYDFILCGGLCDDILEPAAAQVFTGVKNLTAVSYPGLGHGLNYHLGAPGMFEVIFNWLSGNGF